MKKLLLSIGLLGCYAILTAQPCTPVPVNSGALIYATTGSEHSNSGDQLWICQGVTMEISGDGNIIWVERASTITLSGSNNTIYQKRGGSLDITGNDNTVKHAGSFTPTNGGTGNNLSTCDTVFYDYSSAPTTGACDPYIGLQKVDEQNTVSIFPNPANSFIQVEGLTSGNASFELYDLNGRMVHSGPIPANGVIDVNAVPKGLYLLNVNRAEGLISERVRIE